MTSISSNLRPPQARLVDPADGGDGAQASAPPVRRRSRGRWRVRLEIALLTGPALIIFVTFVIFPVGVAAYYGFFSWPGIGPATLEALRDYVRV